MHFHLPKPLHGWREFIGEVGIIVIGVLIALAAEQAVEAVHWREQMGGTRDQLYSEAASNLRVAKWRQLQQPCIERRLNDVVSIFRLHAAGKSIRLLRPIGHPVYLSSSQPGWQIALSSQSLLHMSLDERTNFADAFGNYEDLARVLDREQEAWLKLDALDHPDLLADGDWPILHQAYAEAAMLNARLDIITHYVLSRQSLGQKPQRFPVPIPPPFQRGLQTICAPVFHS
jgi:hypothetical protein